jgi:hypothetical protein
MKETIFPLFLLILALLIGCNSDSLGLSSAMEEAIAKQYATVSDFQLRQQVPWQEGGLALVTFDAVNNRDMVFEDCYGIGYFRSLSAAYYTVFAAASSCDKVMSDVVTEGEPAAAFGKVNYSEGAQVRVDWFDGQSDTVDIVDQFYLGPREGFSEVKEALLLDGDGSELASIEP